MHRNPGIARSSRDAVRMRARVRVIATTCLALLGTGAAFGAANSTAQEPARTDSGAAAGPAATPVIAARPATPRPRIGLVLGGGGAKGAAHVGVLTLLEEMRIPIDCVVGTSMGALVGGTYASGSDGCGTGRVDPCDLVVRDDRVRRAAREAADEAQARRRHVQQLARVRLPGRLAVRAERLHQHAEHRADDPVPGCPQPGRHPLRRPADSVPGHRHRHADGRHGRARPG